MLPASSTSISYRSQAMGEDEGRWPEAGRALLDELRACPGRLALIAGVPADVDGLVGQLVADLGLTSVRLGLALADRCTPPTLGEVEATVGRATVLADLDLLLWPDLAIAPLAFLSNLARHRPTIAAWPGEIAGGRARYSRPGRPDYHDRGLRDAAILRPVPTRFPDELPYTLERIAP